ncbi:hypothetical protein ACOME3_004241 [Neoechinorhynchus agilis]
MKRNTLQINGINIANMIEPQTDDEVQDVVQNTKGIPIIFDFYTKWIPEVVNKLGKQNVQILRVNVERVPDLIREYNIVEVPCTVGFDQCNNLYEKRLFAHCNYTDVREFVLGLTQKGESCIKHLQWGKVKNSDAEREDELNSIHKFYLFANEPVADKPSSSIPGIGDTYSERLAKSGINNARQLIAIYMKLSNFRDFEEYLKRTCSMNKRWRNLVAKAIAKNVRRML